MYNDTITLFNRYSSNAGDIWFPTVLYNVDVNLDKAVAVSKFGENTTDKGQVHIKYQTKGGVPYVKAKRYVLPKEWENQLTDEQKNSITFTSGEEFDFIYVGEYPEALIKDDDYTKGFFDYMKKTYDEVYAITSVAKYDVIPHFEISIK